MKLLLQTLTLLSLVQTAFSNVEKTIFLGPDPIPIPLTRPTLSDLFIDTLTPTNWSLRTHVSAKFPTTTDPKGHSTWLILDNLTPSQRYEVRICWAATVRPPFPFSINLTDTCPSNQHPSASKPTPWTQSFPHPPSSPP